MAKILSKFGEQQLVMVNYARGFNQSETGKYFECIIKVCINTTFNSAVLMLTKYQKCIFLSVIMISTDTARVRMTEVLDFYARWSGCNIYFYNNCRNPSTLIG